MKKTIITTLIGIVLGGCITVTYFAVRSSLELRNTVNQQGIAIQEIANFINKTIEAQKAVK